MVSDLIMKLPYNNKQTFPPILPDHDEWPVVKLSKHRAEFVDLVTREAVARIKSLRPGTAELIKELEATRYKEKLRLQNEPWEVDPDDEVAFWKKVKADLMEISGKKETGGREDEILERIVRRYADEIAGHFKHSYYRLAREIVTFGFARLLNASQADNFAGLFRGKRTLRDKIRIRGYVEQIRKLAKLGTIVMVPTHFSNLDSILIGWVIHELGLPPFIYGAGLNLFNLKLFAYFMDSVGAYKVDRRKKNLIYLETLKMFSNLAIQQGCHSLFFPGGTRSRSGMIEKKLKLGLLGTAMEAQRINYEKDNGQRIFVVPVVLNYNFVLEAPSLIHQYLEREGQEKYYIDSDNYTTSYKIVKFLIKFFTKQAEISVTLGRAMDLFGNYVNDDGQSIGKLGRPIDPKGYFMQEGRIVYDKQRDEEYTRLLSQRIIEEYHKFNEVLPSHLVAFVAYLVFRKKFSNLDLFSFLRLPEDEISLEYITFMEYVKKVVDALKMYEEKERLLLAPEFEKPLEELVQTGLNNLGMYHARRPLLRHPLGHIYTQDLSLLYYYHNRLVGYNLEQYVR